jgi:transposase
MEQISIVGLDIAKSVFQVHAVSATGVVLLRRQLRRSEVLKFFGKLGPCLVGMEACASAHYWGREIAALGHDVRLMPPVRVKAYVKWGKKNDAADAAAIAEAATRPSIQCVPIKTIDQQSALMLHGARKLLVEQRTRLVNAMRSHLAEVGAVTAVGEAGFKAVLAIIDDPYDDRLPPLARLALAPLATQWRTAGEQIDALDRQILEWHKHSEDSRRLASIPHIGPIIASTMVATIGNAKRFKNGRQFAAWLGLVPSDNSTGGKQRLGRITKTGNSYVRQLLVLAAFGMSRRLRKDPSLSPWLAELRKNKPPKQAAIAYANKLARISWAILAKGTTYQAALA